MVNLSFLAPPAAYLKSLHSCTEEDSLLQLLSHLPLLNPGNSEARSEYMKLLTKVMLGSSEELEYLEQCRQLLSLALVHPAFPHEDREALTYWLSQLDSKHKTIADRTGVVSSPQCPPAIPPRIRQIQTNEDVRLSPTNGRIYIEGDLNHSFYDSHSSDPYNADDEEVQRTLGSSKTLQPRQALFNVDHGSPLPSSFEEGLSFRDRSNTVPRVGPKEDGSGGLGVNIEWDFGMKGEKWSL